MNHYLIFDFVNGKTKTLSIKDEKTAIEFLNTIHDDFCRVNSPDCIQSFRYGNDKFINLNNVCSVKYVMYPKDKE